MNLFSNISYKLNVSLKYIYEINTKKLQCNKRYLNINIIIVLLPAGTCYI